jgi:SAM-dependent methyltransferase
MNEQPSMQRGQACVLCGAMPLLLWRRGNLDEPLRPRHFAITDFAYGKTLDLYRCPRCGLRQCTDVRGILAHYEKLEDYDYDVGRAQRALQMRRLLARLQRYVSSGALLDIGAASGILVEEALHLGYQARGVEPSRAFQAVAAQRRLPVTLGTLPHPALAGPFDAVTLVDVIEHVEDPVGLLSGAAGVLRPGAMGLLVTPDVRSVAARLMGLRWWHYRLAHIRYFDRQTLRRLVHTCGLQVVAEFRPTWEFSLDYLWVRGCSYLPRSLRYQPPRIAASVCIPLNLRDSLAVIFRRPPGACA